jgi:hypothetical protein
MARHRKKLEELFDNWLKLMVVWSTFTYRQDIFILQMTKVMMPQIIWYHGYSQMVSSGGPAEKLVSGPTQQLQSWAPISSTFQEILFSIGGYTMNALWTNKHTLPEEIQKLMIHEAHLGGLQGNCAGIRG